LWSVGAQSTSTLFRSGVHFGVRGCTLGAGNWNPTIRRVRNWALRAERVAQNPAPLASSGRTQSMLRAAQARNSLAQPQLRAAYFIAQRGQDSGMRKVGEGQFMEANTTLKSTRHSKPQRRCFHSFAPIASSICLFGRFNLSLSYSYTHAQLTYARMMISLSFSFCWIYPWICPFDSSFGPS
jgi:hypothetical protein